MKTTLHAILLHSPCGDGWRRLLKNLGKTRPDDEPLSILTIMKSNGLDDALWALRAVKGYDREIRLFAVWCARQVQHLMTDQRSLEAMDVAERFANGNSDDDELSAAGTSAWAAAEAAAGDAAEAAAGDAAEAAARAAARAAAWAAEEDSAEAVARAAAWAAAGADAGTSAWAAALAAAWAAARAAAGAAEEDSDDDELSAARDAARDAQKAKLIEICEACQ